MSQELIYVDPAELRVDAGNVRRDMHLDDAFVQSNDEFGDLEPIAATRNGDGDLTVLMGHRRTAAALQVGAEKVPVWVMDNHEIPESLRILVQVAENDQRAGITNRDRVEAIDALFEHGMTADAIAQGMSLSRADVAAARKAAASELVLTVAEDYQGLDLVQLAVLAEFEDHPEWVAELADAAVRGDWEHKLRWIRREQEAERLTAAKIAELEAEGVRAVAVGTLSRYATVSGNVCTVDALEPALTDKEHESCPGHAVGVVATSRYVDGESTLEVQTGPVCVDFREHGHRHHWDPRPEPTDDEQAAAEAARIEREKAEAAAKAEREAHEEALAVAQDVRREFVVKLLAGKLPTDWPVYVAYALTADRYIEIGSDLAEEWTASIRKASAPTNAQASRAILAAVLAIHEEGIGRPWNVSQTASYLQWLQGHGYVLSEVELGLVADDDDDVVDVEVVEDGDDDE